MATRGRVFGRECTWTVDPDGVGRWRYPDGTVAAQHEDPMDPMCFEFTADVRPCPGCDELPGEDTVDPCLGRMPGVTTACCGHGVGRGYVAYEDGRHATAEEVDALRRAGIDRLKGVTACAT